MNLRKLYEEQGFNKVYQILSKEVSIFEKRMETLLFVKYLGKNTCILLKKNKSPITPADKILNPNYHIAEQHFKSVRFLKKFKGFIFKVGVEKESIRLHHVDKGDKRYSDEESLAEYSKLLKIDPIEFLYKGDLNAQQKNEIIGDYILEESRLAGIFKDENNKETFHNFNSKNNKSIPNDINVLIINDFIDFFNKNNVYIKYHSDNPQERYVQLMNLYIHNYLYSKKDELKRIEFTNPNSYLAYSLIPNDLSEILAESESLVVIYKIILGTFQKNITSRGLYTKSDITAIKETINKINLKLKGLDFINLIN